MSRPRLRTRVAVLLVALLATGGVLAAAAPAQAWTFDHDRVETFAFTVAGHPYTLRDAAVGKAEQTIRIGRSSGTVWSRWRLTFTDAHGHVVDRADRGLYRNQAVVDAFSNGRFRSVAAFRGAEHRALAVTEARAKASYRHMLRIESVDSDLEANIGQVFDYLQTLPKGATPDFDSVATIQSDEYPGSVTVSGTDRTHWSVIVRDTRDGYGDFFDEATGSEAVFRF